MTSPGATTTHADAAVRDVAEKAAQQAPELGRDIWERALDGIPGARDWEASLREAGAASAEANVRELAAHLARSPHAGAMHAPAPALAHARQFARQGVPLSALLRIYQLGHEVWRDFYVGALGTHRTAEELVVASGIVSTVTFAYLHAASEELSEAYEAEQARVAASGEAARRETVAALLAGEAVEPGTVAARLGIELGLSHTALVAWAPPEEGEPGAALEELLRRAAAALGIQRPLVLRPGASTAWAWLSRLPAPGAPPLPDVLSASGLSTGAFGLTCGTEAPGIDGFRASHEEALAARPFVTPGARGAGVVTYAEVELAALLLADARRARRFARRELGGLAAPGEPAARLRGTLAAYLRAGASATHAAHTLSVHKNTVVYRVRQAVAARGAPLDHRRLELEAALRLVEARPDLLEP